MWTQWQPKHTVIFSYAIDSVSKQKGSSIAVPSGIIIVSSSPYRIVLIGLPESASVSAITCLQAPQGLMGFSVHPSVLRAAIAMAITAFPG